MGVARIVDRKLASRHADRRSVEALDQLQIGRPKHRKLTPPDVYAFVIDPRVNLAAFVN